MININNQQLTLSNQDRIFVELVDNRITMYKQIPYTVPQNLIVDIIKESARLFYRYSWSSSKTSFYRLDIEAILDFQQVETENQNLHLRDIGNVVTLPSYVATVKAIHETNKSSGLTDATGIRSNRSVNNRMYGIDSSLYALEHIAKIVEQTAFNAIFDKPLNFHFNPLIKQLEIYTDAIENPLILECDVNIPIQYLYQNDLFIRHVVGRTKQELKRLIASHTITLPGDVTLNADEICNNIEDVEKVEELLKQSSGVGDIILTNDD